VGKVRGGGGWAEPAEKEEEGVWVGVPKKVRSDSNVCLPRGGGGGKSSDQTLNPQRRAVRLNLVGGKRDGATMLAHIGIVVTRYRNFEFHRNRNSLRSGGKGWFV